MNDIKLYSKEQVVNAATSLIKEKKTLNEIKIYNSTTSIFDELIEFSKTISDNTMDIELAIKMDNHKYFKSLTKEQASKEELWATLNIEYFSVYTQRRWLKENPSENQIKQRVFKSGKLLYNRNSMARLWWITKQSKDERLSDPYLYTKILLTRTQFDQSILESTLAKNDKLLKNIMAAIVLFEEEHRQISSEEIKDIVKRLNLLGGTYVLDIMDVEYFYAVICSTLGVKEESGMVNIFKNTSFMRNILNR